MHRGRIMFIGDERAGKTSTKKSLFGIKFDPQEPPTEAMELDQSSFKLDVDNAQHWKIIEGEERQSDLTDQVARVVAAGVKAEQENQKKTEAV